MEEVLPWLKLVTISDDVLIPSLGEKMGEDLSHLCGSSEAAYNGKLAIAKDLESHQAELCETFGKEILIRTALTLALENGPGGVIGARKERDFEVGFDVVKGLAIHITATDDWRRSRLKDAFEGREASGTETSFRRLIGDYKMSHGGQIITLDNSTDDHNRPLENIHSIADRVRAHFNYVD